MQTCSPVILLKQRYNYKETKTILRDQDHFAAIIAPEFRCFKNVESVHALFQGFFSSSFLPWHLKKKQEYHFITLMID